MCMDVVIVEQAGGEGLGQTEDVVFVSWGRVLVLRPIEEWR